MQALPATAPGARAAADPRAARRMVAVLASATVLIALMQTILVPLLSTLPQLLSTSPSNASWAVTATLLTAAIATPISGRLGDMFGKRRVLLACLVLLTIGSIVVALTSQIGWVVLGRSMQGAASSILPLSIAILREELPRDRVPGGVALISATLGVGSSLGLPVAAVVAQNLDWHWIFAGTAVLGAVAFVAVLRVVPASRIRTPGRFDFVGALGLTVGLLFLLLVVSKGNTWGWTSPLVLGLGVVGVLVLVAWAWYQTTLREPLVDVRVSSRRPVLLTNLASVMAGFAMMATGLVPPQILQAPTGTGYGLGQSMVAAGLCLAPAGVVQMLLSPVAGRIVVRFGARVTLVLGLATITVGFGAALLTMSAVWGIIVSSLINGVGIGLAFAAMPVLIMSAVPVSESAAANGLNTLARAVGASISSAIVGLVLASLTLDLGGLALPTRGAFQVTLLIGTLGGLVGVVFALFIPRPLPGGDEIPDASPPVAAPMAAPSTR
jgi:EmrB/QacA subfamily drug resistance transporter